MFRDPLLQSLVGLLAIGTGLIQGHKCILLNHPSKSIVLGKATKGATFDNNRWFWNLQHHPNDGSLRDKATNFRGGALVAFCFDNGLVEARSIEAVDSVDPLKQRIR